MQHALRNILGMFAGLFAAVLIIGGIQALSSLIYPLPEGVDVNDREAMKAFIGSLPAGAFGLVLASYFTGTLVGTWLTSRIIRGVQRAPAFAVGSLLFAAAVLNMLSIPHPGWFMIVCVLAFPVATALGIRLNQFGSRAAGE